MGQTATSERRFTALTRFEDPLVADANVRRAMRELPSRLTKGFAVHMGGQVWQSIPNQWTHDFLSGEPMCFAEHWTIQSPGEADRETCVLQLALAMRFNQVERVVDSTGAEIEREVLTAWASDHNLELWRWRLENADALKD